MRPIGPRPQPPALRVATQVEQVRPRGVLSGIRTEILTETLCDTSSFAQMSAAA
jgi:hypothetical protein